MARKLVVEAIGTLFLVMTVGLTVLEPGPGALAPIAIGSVLMVMVYAGGYISGGHYNPAVTLGAFLRGKVTAGELGGYWVAQLVGGVIGALLAGLLKGMGTPAPAPPPVVPALIAEFLFTFALVYVVLTTATTRGNEGNSYYGLAIGFTLMVAVFAIGSISGGAINPAVAVGVSILRLSPWGSLWIFIVADLLGGAAAGLLFNALHMDAGKPTTATPEEAAELREAGAPERRTA